MKKHRILRILALNLLILALLLGSIELVFRGLAGFGMNRAKIKYPPNPRVYATESLRKEFGEEIFKVPAEYQREYPPVTSGGNYTRYFQPKNFHEVMLGLPKEPIVFRSKAIRNQEKEIVVYDVSYSINQFGHRKVLNQDTKKTTTRFVIALGDSFTFGEALEDGNDYPSLLAKKVDSKTKVYNFGYPAAAPNDFYVILAGDSKRFLRILAEPEGDFVYLFIPAHIHRFFCPLSCYRKSNEYILDKHELEWDQDKIVDHGAFRDSKAIHRIFLQILGQSQLLSFFNFDWPVSYSEKQLEDFVRTVAFIRDSFEPEVKIKRSQVYIYQYFSQQKELGTLFKKFGFKVRNLNNLKLNRFLKHETIPGDGHPTAEFNWLLTEVIKADLDRAEPH